MSAKVVRIEIQDGRTVDRPRRGKGTRWQGRRAKLGHAVGSVALFGVILFTLAGCPQAPVLSLSPTTLNFGETGTQNTFEISNTGSGTLTYTVTESLSWLALLDPDTNAATNEIEGAVTTEADEIRVVIDRTDFEEGTVTGTITVTVDGVEHSVTVSATTPAPPALHVSDSTIDFGYTGVDRSVYISNTGSQVLNWSASVSPGDDWLTVSPASGTLIQTGVLIPLTMLTDRTGLSVGEYTATLSFYSNGGDVTVAVTMSVPAFQVSQNSIDFGFAPGLVSQQLDIFTPERVRSLNSKGRLGLRSPKAIPMSPAPWWT